MVIGLYTSRVVLATLGVEDYGIYGVVGSVVGMFGFLNTSMAGATSRFLTFELGRGSQERLDKTFSTSLIIHVGIALVILFIAETLGLWFLNNKLVIPPERMNAARWVYQLSILGAMLGITQVPYNATIIAHEKMTAFAYIDILNSVLKLLIVYLLVIGNFDKLILYAILTLCVNILILSIYRIYCIRHFQESHFQWIWEKTYIKPMLSFSGWSIYGDMAHTVRQQGANFLLNIFYGPVINAASMVASTVQGILMGFSANILISFKPQIIKSYASSEFERLNQLINFGSKLSGILLLYCTMPVLVMPNSILRLWLGQVPDGAVIMMQLNLLVNIFAGVNTIIINGIQATGKITTTSLVCGTIYLLTIPGMYVLLRFGFGYSACYWLVVVVSFLFCIFNLFILKHNIQEFKITNYYLKSFIPLLITGIFSFAIVNSIYSKLLTDDFISLVLVTLISIFVITILAFLIMFSNQERCQIFAFIKSKIHR